MMSHSPKNAQCLLYKILELQNAASKLESNQTFLPPKNNSRCSHPARFETLRPSSGTSPSTLKSSPHTAIHPRSHRRLQSASRRCPRSTTALTQTASFLQY